MLLVIVHLEGNTVLFKKIPLVSHHIREKFSTRGLMIDLFGVMWRCKEKSESSSMHFKSPLCDVYTKTCRGHVVLVPKQQSLVALQQFPIHLLQC